MVPPLTLHKKIEINSYFVFNPMDSTECRTGFEMYYSNIIIYYRYPPSDTNRVFKFLRWVSRHPKLPHWLHYCTYKYLMINHHI